MARIGEALSRLRYLVPAAAIVWRAAGRWTILSFGLLFVQGILPAAFVYLTKHLVDGLSAAMSLGPTREGIESVAFPALLMGGVMLLTQILDSVGGYVNTAQAELVQDEIKSKIHHQSASLDIAFFESSESYDLLSQANTQASTAPLELIKNFGAMLRQSITLLAIAGLLLPYGVWLPLLLLVSTVPAFLIVLKYNRAYHEWWASRTGVRRRAQYYDTLLTLDVSASEIRVFDLGNFFAEEYRSLRELLRRENLQLQGRQVVAQLGAAMLALVLTAGALGWIIWRSLSGAFTLGDIALFYQAFNQGQSLLRNLLGNVGQVHRNLLFLENLFTFLDVTPRIRGPITRLLPPGQLNEGIRFENVTFRYPNSEHPALEDFHLFIPAGKTTAIVGVNGAGKSTIIKLICRFYDPEDGKVTLDGVDLRVYEPADLWRKIAAMFQFFVRYQATAGENIGVGRRGSELERERVHQAAHQALIHDTILRLPEQYDTHLGKWFTAGSELSGGEWQRVTLARAFYRDAPIIILDEPTSAMDSWAENLWLDGFAEMARGKTALVITHRFTTAMRADIIHVMDRGKVIESGTHHSLLALDGQYARSWNAQMSHHFVGETVRGGAVADDTDRALSAIR